MNQRDWLNLLGGIDQERGSAREDGTKQQEFVVWRREYVCGGEVGEDLGGFFLVRDEIYVNILSNGDNRER